VPLNKTLTTQHPRLKWYKEPCAKTYTVIVKDKATGKLADKQGGLTGLKYITDTLPLHKSYKWFVKACNTNIPPPRCSKSDASFFTLQ
jgi:hypothetical protein